MPTCCDASGVWRPCTGAEPQFLLASATIANPGELASTLTGLEATVVSGDSAPRAERTIVLWNPPVTDEELNLRASALGEGARLLAELVERGLRTLCFAKSRKAAELIHRFALDRLGREYADRLSPYRAGYTPAQRRDIEQRLAAGELLGVSATDALELGIDIGLLDCVISVGFPGTVASLRQQWGRAGRQGHGVAVLVASDDALDQYFMREPDALLGRRVEAAILDHANPRVLDGHVLAAAYEAPLDDDDRATLGDEALERAAELPELRRTAAGFTWTGRDYPAARISLRSAGVDSVLVVEAESGSVLGIVERERAYSTVHAGAVYLHLGEPYLVSELDLAAGAALVEPFSGGLVHRPRRTRRPRSRRPCSRRSGPASTSRSVASRSPSTSSRTSGSRPGTARYWRRLRSISLRRRSRRKPSGSCLPPRCLTAWSRCPSCSASLHAAEHALIALLPLFAMCDRWDIGGLSTNVHFQTGAPTVFVYDGHPGGVGIAERGYARVRRLGGGHGEAPHRMPV